MQIDKSFRVMRDAFGEMRIPFDKLWGAQTQRYEKEKFGLRSLQFFKINLPQDIMPIEIIDAIAAIKIAAASSNYKKGKLAKKIFEAIKSAGDEVLSGTLKEHFPLSIWQTGSGTQTNMNVNEVTLFKP